MIARTVRARASLRLGFGGGGTDVSPYCDEHGGLVLNATIDLFAHATISTRPDNRLALAAADQGVAWVGPADADVEADPSVRLLKAVYDRFAPQFPGGAPGLTITTYADAPPGSGLGTSSAMVVALVSAMLTLLDRKASPAEIARLAFEIERVDLGLAGGRQDQYAAAFGGFNLMSFEAHERVQVQPLQLSHVLLKELEASLVLYFTGVSRDSASVIDDQAANMRRREPQALEALHALKDGARRMTAALDRCDLREFGRLLDAGWTSKKALASRVSNPAIDEVYEAAKAYGVFGGKVSGAGGGGFMMFLVDPPRREGLRRLLARFGGAPMNAKFYPSGVECWEPEALPLEAASDERGFG